MLLQYIAEPRCDYSMRLGLGSSLFAPIHCAAVVLEGPGGQCHLRACRWACVRAENDVVGLADYVDSVATNAYSAFFLECCEGHLCDQPQEI